MFSPVLDASAVLAVIFEEAGADRVAEHIPGAAISAVNLAEVLAKLRDLGMPETTIEAILEELQPCAVPSRSAPTGGLGTPAGRGGRED